jgi:hypothetical protein
VPTTFLLTSYWDNLVHFGLGPKRGADGVLALVLPTGGEKLPGIAAEDIGRCACGIPEAGPDLAGRTIGIAGEHLTGAEVARALGRALGEEVRYAEVSPEAYRGLGLPGADDLGNVFRFKRDFNADYRRARDPAARRLNPSLRTSTRGSPAMGTGYRRTEGALRDACADRPGAGAPREPRAAGGSGPRGRPSKRQALPKRSAPVPLTRPATPSAPAGRAPAGRRGNPSRIRGPSRAGGRTAR